MPDCRDCFNCVVKVSDFCIRCKKGMWSNANMEEKKFTLSLAESKTLKIYCRDVFNMASECDEFDGEATDDIHR